MSDTKLQRRKPKRSGSVTVAGWLAILSVPLILTRVTVTLLREGVALGMVKTISDPAAWTTTQGLDAFVMFLVFPVAILSLFTGIAILQQRRWAWVVLVLFLAVALVLNLIRSYYHEPEYALMLVYAGLALVLNQPEVRQAFQVGRARHEPVE